MTKWEGMSFADQLRLLRNTAVLGTGVGTGMMNAFMLPPGAVAFCLGWRDPHGRAKITYFDSHLLNSLDHVRVLYYPSYEPSELGGSSVTLRVPKATKILQQALEIHAGGFPIPVPSGANANVRDRAYQRLAEKTRGMSHQLRTGDEPFPPRGSRCLTNSPDSMFWGPLSQKCAFAPWVEEVKREFNL